MSKVKVTSNDVIKIDVYKKFRSKYRPYWYIGKEYGRDMDILDLIRSLNDSEYWMLKLLIDRMTSKKHIGVIRGKTLTKTEKQRVYRGYKGLREKDLVRRIKREYYMVNPIKIGAHPEYRDDLLEDYNRLK